MDLLYQKLSDFSTIFDSTRNLQKQIHIAYRFIIFYGQPCMDSFVYCKSINNIKKPCVPANHVYRKTYLLADNLIFCFHLNDILRPRRRIHRPHPQWPHTASCFDHHIRTSCCNYRYIACLLSKKSKVKDDIYFFYTKPKFI